MKALLHTGESKSFRAEGRHNDIELWSLTSESTRPDRTLSVIINGVAFGIVASDRYTQERENLPPDVPTLVLRLQELVNRKAGWWTGSRLVWQALGMDMGAYEEMRAKMREKSEAHKAFDREQEEKKAKAEAAHLNRIEDAIRSGKAVSGENLLALAKLLRVTVSPRSAGAIKKMSEIEPHRSIGPKTQSYSQFALYAEVRRKLAQVDPYR